MCYINEGNLTLLVVAEGSGSAVSHDESLCSLQQWLGVACSREHWVYDQIGPLGSCGAGVVGKELHLVVLCWIAVDDRYESCESIPMPWELCSTVALVGMYRLFENPAGLVVG